MFLSQAKTNEDGSFEAEEKGEGIIRYSNSSENFMTGGFMFVIVENQQTNMMYVEEGDYSGSSGLTRVGANPNDMDYKLEGKEGVNGVIYRINLRGFSMRCRVGARMQQC
jgi:hypothetical protein